MQRFLIPILAALCNIAAGNTVLAQAEGAVIQETEAEKFYQRALDPQRRLRFEVSSRGRPRLWSGGAVLWQGAPLPPTPQVYDQRASFSPDGARLLLVAAGSATRLYNVQTGQVEADWTAQAQIGLNFAFAPDSMHVASQIYDSNSKPVIVVWNIARNSREATLPVPSFERDVRGIDFYFGPEYKPS